MASRRTPPGRPAPLHFGVLLVALAVTAPVALLLGLLVPADPAAALAPRQGAPPPEGTGVDYAPPVDAPITDPFRPPTHHYGSGNRGIEYATVPGTPVVAIGVGTVVFAGNVGGSLHVTVEHPDGLRSSYSFLAEVHTFVGRHVEQGERLGTAGTFLHLGVRAGHDYLDPALLFGDGIPAVHLVPHTPPGGTSLLDELRELWSLTASAGSDLGAWLPVVAAWTFPAVPGFWLLAAPPGPLGHQMVSLSPLRRFGSLVTELRSALGDGQECSSADVVVPPPAGRRVLVTVGGLGSTSGGAAVDDLDTAGLGYAAADVVRFSYRGGRTPATGAAFPGIEAHRYAAEDTTGDLLERGAALAELIEEVSRAAPGAPIDLVAHSQGGVVARLALDLLAAEGRLPDDLEVVVTLGSPHQGADLATGLAGLQDRPVGRLVLDGIEVSGVAPLDPDGEALAQLSETSDLVESLRGRPLPEGVRFVSVAAAQDWLVTAPRTRVPGATNVTLDVAGPTAHDALPGSAGASRVIGLARAGLPPPCRGLLDTVIGVVGADVIAASEDTLGVGAGLAAYALGVAVDLE